MQQIETIIAEDVLQNAFVFKSFNVILCKNVSESGWEVKSKMAQGSNI